MIGGTSSGSTRTHTTTMKSPDTLNGRNLDAEDAVSATGLGTSLAELKGRGLTQF
jgi:hypothetical protein